MIEDLDLFKKGVELYYRSADKVSNQLKNSREFFDYVFIKNRDKLKPFWEFLVFKLCESTEKSYSQLYLAVIDAAHQGDIGLVLWTDNIINKASLLFQFMRSYIQDFLSSSITGNDCFQVFKNIALSEQEFRFKDINPEYLRDNIQEYQDYMLPVKDLKKLDLTLIDSFGEYVKEACEARGLRLIKKKDDYFILFDNFIPKKFKILST